MKKSNSEVNVLKSAIEKGYNIDSLTHCAISKGIFPKHGTNENYSASWVKGRLKLDDIKVTEKLIEFCSNI
jgi:hypothetical protein